MTPNLVLLEVRVRKELLHLENGFELEWGKMEELINNMELAFKLFKDRIERFLEVLAQITN